MGTNSTMHVLGIINIEHKPISLIYKPRFDEHFSTQIIFPDAEFIRNLYLFNLS